ncbi:hypothetical protein, partial [Bradyrhizobium sp. LeoA1S1]
QTIAARKSRPAPPSRSSTSATSDAVYPKTELVLRLYDIVLSFDGTTLSFWGDAIASNPESISPPHLRPNGFRARPSDAPE